ATKLAVGSLRFVDVQICKSRFEPGDEHGDIFRPKRNTAARKRRMDHFGHHLTLLWSRRDQPGAMIVINYDRGFAKISHLQLSEIEPVPQGCANHGNHGSEP